MIGVMIMHAIGAREGVYGFYLCCLQQQSQHDRFELMLVLSTRKCISTSIRWISKRVWSE